VTPITIKSCTGIIRYNNRLKYQDFPLTLNRIRLCGHPILTGNRTEDAVHNDQCGKNCPPDHAKITYKQLLPIGADEKTVAGRQPHF
jgi:hypothetical protein